MQFCVGPTRSNGSRSSREAAAETQIALQSRDDMSHPPPSQLPADSSQPHSREATASAHITYFLSPPTVDERLTIGKVCVGAVDNAMDAAARRSLLIRESPTLRLGLPLFV